MMQALERMMGPLQRRVMLMIGRAVLAVIDDGKALQSLQVNLLADETRDDVERFQEYGYTSHPHPGAEAVAVSVTGTRDHVLVIAVDDRRYRLKGLEQGEVALYTDEGDSIILKRGNIIQVTAATKLEVITPLAHFTGDIAVDGRIDAQGDVTGQGTSLHTHVHQEQGDFSPVSAPL
jgi:phage gp45-like